MVSTRLWCRSSTLICRSDAGPIAVSQGPFTALDLDKEFSISREEFPSNRGFKGAEEEAGNCLSMIFVLK